MKQLSELREEVLELKIKAAFWRGFLTGTVFTSLAIGLVLRGLGVL